MELIYIVGAPIIAYLFGISAGMKGITPDANKIADFFEDEAVKYEKKVRAFSEIYSNDNRADFRLISEDCWDLAERARIHAMRKTK